MASILLVEDDYDLNTLIKDYLTKLGYDVVATSNGLDALNEINVRTFDLILSDIMMPLCDGYELVRQVRLSNNNLPIILMSARDDKISKQMGYNKGIDDYITKPFDIEELGYKIAAILRRTNINNTNVIQIGNFLMDKEEYTAYLNEEELALTVREFNILYKMLSYPKKIFTRSKLMEEFWDFDTSATSRTVDVYMAKLRDKTKNCDGFEIQTVHGLGYKVVLK